MNITVFCSSLSKPGDLAYEEGRLLGQLLAEAGHSVLTGGYIGTMEAISRGAAEAGGHVIGVTCEEIEAWRAVRANPWVKEERRFPTLRLRLFGLIEMCDAAIALQGGIGTLAEVAILWSHLQTQAIAARPLILVGRGWRKVMETFWEEFPGQVPVAYHSLLTFAEDVDEAIHCL